MSIIYKHRTTGEYYDSTGYSNFNKKISKRFDPWNKNLDNLTIEVDWIHDTDKLSWDFKDEELIAHNRKLQDENHQALYDEVDKVFETITANPIITVEDEPKYVKVIVEMHCPLCGAPLKQHGSIYLTDPLQYEHVCTNKDCGYHTCMARWYAGQELWALSKAEAYRVITSGTADEKDELDERSSKFKKNQR